MKSEPSSTTLPNHVYEDGLENIEGHYYDTADSIASIQSHTIMSM